MYGIASGMSFLHKHKILHRDLKLQNVLLDINSYPKITDFGLAKMFESNVSSMNIQSTPGIKGSPLFIAPEVLDFLNYSNSSDVYSFGFMVYILMTQEYPFQNLSFKQLFDKIANGDRPPIPETIPPSYKELIQKCWDQDPKKRPSFDTIMEKLKNDRGFITRDVDEIKFHNYVDFVDNYEKSFDISKGPRHIRTFSQSYKRSEIESYFSEEENKKLDTESISQKIDTNPEEENENLEPKSIDQQIDTNPKEENEKLDQKSTNQQIDTNPKEENEKLEPKSIDQQIGLFPKEEYEKLDEQSKKLVRESEEDPHKMFIVAKKLIKGEDGFTKNVNLGLDYLESSLVDDFDDPHFYSCKILIDGKVIKPDFKKARTVLDGVNDKKSPEYIFYLGLIEKRSSNYKKALEYFKEAADKGHAESMYKYAKMLNKGQGTRKNVKKANEYFIMSSKNGCTKTFKPKYKEENVILSFKVSFIGDVDSGKHDLVYYLTNDKVIDKIPTHVDNNKLFYNYYGQCVKMNLVDSYGLEDYKRAGQLIYDKTSIFVFVFSLIDKSSLQNIINKWYYKIEDYKKDASVVLIGLNLDKWNSNEEDPNHVTQSEIKEAERVTNSNFSILCSISTGENITDFKNKLAETYINSFYQVNPKSNDKKEIDLKVLFVGNKEAGQYELLEYADKGFFPRDRHFTRLTKYINNVTYKGTSVNLHLFSTPGDEDYQRIRALSYNNADVIVLIFSLIFKESFHSLFRTYLNEIEKLAPNAALLLVGVDSDKWNQDIFDLNFVTKSELDIYSKSDKFQKTIFGSISTCENLEDFSDQIIGAYLSKNGVKNSSCNIF